MFDRDLDAKLQTVDEVLLGFALVSALLKVFIFTGVTIFLAYRYCKSDQERNKGITWGVPLQIGLLLL